MKEQKKKDPRKTTKAKAVKPEAAVAPADVRKIVEDIIGEEFGCLVEIRDALKEIVELLRNNDKKLPDLGYDWTRTPAPPPPPYPWTHYNQRTPPWPHDPWGSPVPYAGPGDTTGDEPPKPDRRIWVDRCTSVRQ